MKRTIHPHVADIRPKLFRDKPLSARYKTLRVNSSKLPQWAEVVKFEWMDKPNQDFVTAECHCPEPQKFECPRDFWEINGQFMVCPLCRQLYTLKP